MASFLQLYQSVGTRVILKEGILAKKIEPADVIPWVAPVLIAFGAAVKAYIDFRNSQMQLEMQQEHQRFMRSLIRDNPALAAILGPLPMAPMMPVKPTGRMG